MALGEITKTLDETINLLCEYMENNCQIKKEYKKRIAEIQEKIIRLEEQKKKYQQ